MRKISFKLLTQAQLLVLETNARTLGELKAEISRNSQLRGKIAFGEVQLIERETKATFGDIDEAILPATDCIMFVVPRKTKSGAILTELAAMSFVDLKAHAEKLMDEDDDLCFDLDVPAADLYDALLDHYERNPEVAEEIKGLVEDLVKVTDIINIVIPKLEALNIEEVTALRVTTNDLQREIEAVSSTVRRS